MGALIRMPNSGIVFSVEVMRVNHYRSSGSLFNMIWRAVDIRSSLKFGTFLNAWDELYQYMTTKYQLNAKVALIGVSRGGLFVYNWAKKNPKKVACIYAEAPVCDFKSWPMGKNGIRSENDWHSLKAAYGFSTDQEAIAYTNNPMDNLELLAENKIPVLHMIGLEDRVVPPEENTYVLVNKYLRLGGIATIVPCTREYKAWRDIILK